MKLNFLLIVIILTFVQSTLAQDNVREITAIGATQKEAVANALLEAVQQVKGVKLKGTEDLQSKLVEVSATVDGESTDVQVMSSSQKTKVAKATEGVIKSYSVLNIDRNPNGNGWQAIVEVVIPIYKTPGISPNSLRKIAVIPFRVKSASMAMVDRDLVAKEVIRQLNQKIVTELTQSRRFTVLDREYMREFLKERNLILSANSPLEEQMKVGEALGVDYLLLGTITEFRGEKTKTYIKALNETVYGAKAYFNADFRIMVMATRQIKWSDTVKVKASKKQLKQILKNGGAQAVTDYMLEKAARKIVHSSLDNIYPIKILKVASKKSIYLNQGGKMTAVGDNFEVYTKGEKIVDPDTGLNIKIDGEKVATIKVTKVQAKYSLAKLVDGNIDAIEAGAILRKASSSSSNSQRRKPVQKVMQPNW